MALRRSATHLALILVALLLVGVALSGCSPKAAAQSPAAAVPGGSPGATNGANGARAGSSNQAAAKITFPQIADGASQEPPSYQGYEPLPSFTYHHVSPKVHNNIAITPATFEAELKTLQSLGYHTVTARDVVLHQTKGTPLPDKPVMITFDDGWANQYDYAWPLLKKYGMKATFFINPQPIAANYVAYMSRAEIVDLAKNGNDIESHTWRHFPVTRSRKVTAAAFQAKGVSELTRANAWIKTVTGQTPVALCYPYGYYDLEAIGLAQAVGYKAGFTVDEGVADARAWDAWQMKRFTISNTENDTSFRRRLLSGALPVTDIQPAPGSRVAGTNVTVSVNVTAVPANLTGLKLMGGPSMRGFQIVTRNGQRYAEAQIKGGKLGFRSISMRATAPDGTVYYAAWGIEIGDSAK